MSASGPKQTLICVARMSAFRGKADIVYSLGLKDFDVGKAEATDLFLQRLFRCVRHNIVSDDGPLRTRYEQRLHVCAACHEWIRRLDLLVQFSFLDERAGNKKGIAQAFSLPDCDVKKSIAEIGPPRLVPAAERLMVGIGRGDYQHIGVRQTRDEDSGIAGGDDYHLVSHTRPRQHVGEFRRRERLREPPCFDCKAGGGAVRGENQKQNIVLDVHLIGCRLQ